MKSTRLLLPAIGVATLSCNVLLDLSSYKDACPAVEQGKPCCEPGDFQDCAYSGPAGTENKGVCKAGRRHCTADGQGFGACEGEVLPAAAEVCDNGLDDDCNGKTDEGCPCDIGKSYPCWTGSKPTRSVGLCTDGKFTCLDGTNYSECKGEVKPASKENCQADGDEDCDGHACADTLWAESFGDEREQHALAVAVAPNGDIVLAGTFTGDIKFGSLAALISADGDEFIARFDKNGKPKWAQQLGGSMSSVDVAVDSNGNAFLAGQTRDGSLPASDDAQGVGPIVVVKYDVDGNAVWSRGCGGDMATGAEQTHIAIGHQDSVVFGGIVTGSGDCGMGSGTFGVGVSSLYVASFSSNGGAPWSNAFGDPSATMPDLVLGGLATDTSGNVWTTGSFDGTLDGHTSAGRDAFLYQLSSHGTVGNRLYFGDGQTQEGLSIDVDANGRPLVAFYNTGTLSFASGKTATTTGKELVLVGFDPLGEANWLKEIDPVPADTDLAFAARYEKKPGAMDQEIVVAGVSLTPIDFGGGAPADRLSFVAKLDPKGEFEWLRAYGTPFDGSSLNGPAPVTLAVDAEQNIVAGGTINGTADFGSGIVLKNTKFDALLFKVAY